MSKEPLYVFWTKRPCDKEAWPMVYRSKDIAKGAPYRVSDVQEVICNDVESEEVREMNDQELEKEIQAKGLNAPRVTPQHVEDVIAEEFYFSGADAARGKGGQITSDSPLARLTFCVLILRNGFTCVGVSACASPENFDAAVGRKAARNHAANKIWALEGYLLRERLHAGATQGTPQGAADSADGAALATNAEAVQTDQGAQGPV